MQLSGNRSQVAIRSQRVNFAAIETRVAVVNVKVEVPSAAQYVRANRSCNAN